MTTTDEPKTSTTIGSAWRVICLDAITPQARVILLLLVIAFACDVMARHIK